MIEKTFLIKNKLGLHARPAALFVQIVNKYKSSVKVVKDEQSVDGRSIMGLMMLVAEFGSGMKIIVEGADEQEVMQKLEELIERKFDEE